MRILLIPALYLFAKHVVAEYGVSIPKNTSSITTTTPPLTIHRSRIVGNGSVVLHERAPEDIDDINRTRTGHGFDVTMTGWTRVSKLVARTGLCFKYIMMDSPPGPRFSR